MRTGGKILIDQLVAQGCRTLFTVPGESFLPALDALFDESPIQAVVCRHEGGAAMMAEATGKLTGAPGVAFVTRAPGATNAASGVYVAHHDSTPMLLLVGLAAQAHEGRGAFQEIDIAALFGAFAKRVDIVRAAERIPDEPGWRVEASMYVCLLSFQKLAMSVHARALARPCGKRNAGDPCGRVLGLG